MSSQTDQSAFVTRDSKQRWDLDCHACNKLFVAQLDHSVNGNHIVICPHCGHQHCRVIVDGKITSERWDSSFETVNVSPRCVWTSDNIPLVTSTAALFIRDRWLNRGD